MSNPVRTQAEWKRPAEKIKLGWIWTALLGTDTIASQTTVGEGVTVEASTFDSTTTAFLASGGTAETTATVTTTITTSGGEVYQGVHTLRIAD